MALLDTPIQRLDGTPATLSEMTDGKVALVVNVASRCSLTPQYAALEAVHEQYADRGFTVIGIPCNQFDSQEPGTRSEIAEFSSTTYGVTFPMTDKVNVNEPDRHPIYSVFLLDRQGVVVRRFRPDTTPDDPQVRTAIESLL